MMSADVDGVSLFHGFFSLSRGALDAIFFSAALFFSTLAGTDIFGWLPAAAVPVRLHPRCHLRIGNTGHPGQADLITGFIIQTGA